jgi:ferric-dicitrate binding protein FerR (iron transport regulator)
MEQKDFIAILKKYRQGVATPEEMKLVDDWYTLMGHAVDQDNADDSELAQLYHSKIYPHVKKSRNSRVRTLIGWSSGLAASMLVAVVAYILIMDYRESRNLSSEKVAAVPPPSDITNTTQETLIIKLPDNSKVSLEPKSSMKFLFSSDRRAVYLNGEAFFEVTHNPKLPFFVHANEVTTKVLGTSFSVKAMEDEARVTVVVKTGKVSVYTNEEKNPISSKPREIILTPNQQIVFDKSIKEISKQIVKNPQVIVPKEELRQMRFEEAPVSEIFVALEKAYGVDIEFDETMFSSCELTTVISDDGLYNRLEIICDAIGTTYQLEEGRIVISGAGCSERTE